MDICALRLADIIAHDRWDYASTLADMKAEFVESEQADLLVLSERLDISMSHIEDLMFLLVSVGQISIQAVIGNFVPKLPRNGADKLEHIENVAKQVAIWLKDLYDLELIDIKASGYIHSHTTLSRASLQKLADTQFLPPRLTKKLDIEGNSYARYTGDYQHFITGKHIHQHDMPINIMAIVQAGTVPWSLDEIVIDTETHHMKPKKEGKHTPHSKEQHKRMVKASYKVFDWILELGNKFYFDGKYDKRGRWYTQGYHINPQGNEYNKALINLHEPLLIGDK